MAIKYNFGIQWQLCQTVLLLNVVYLLEHKPYIDSSSATLDNLNSLFLVFICALITTYSTMNPDPSARFLYGMVFDAVVVLQFIMNIAFVVYQLANQTILKLKQLQFRLKHKDTYQYKIA